MSMEELRNQNKKLKELKTNCQNQLQSLKQTGKSHEAEIDTLLKFNERLLGIIENQFNSATKSKISSDLGIIAETNQASTDLRQHPMFKNKLAIQPPQLGGGGGNYKQEALQGFQEEQEEQIYNQERHASMPVTPVAQSHKEQPTIKKIVKLDKVFQMQQKGLQESINLGSSYQNSNPSNHTSSIQNNERVSEKKNGESQIQELKEMIKEYKQEFVQNSAEYEQICVIIHNDLLKDLDEFRKIQKQSHQFYQHQMTAVNNLKYQIKRFKPVNELARVMKKLNVPPAAERLLQQKIIAKHG